MIALEDRQALAHDIDTAHISGARLRPACEIVGIDVRTLERWKAQDGLTAGDGRPWAVRPTPSHALSPAERAALLAVANAPRFASVPPARIVPMLADEGVYLGSESSMARVLRAHGQNARRGRAKAPKATRPPTTHIATAPAQVWCWDMTYLPANVMGRWFHLYLILDLYSRKIVGAEVHDSDDADHAVHLVRRTALAESIATMETKPVLHGDNGSTLKATTVLAMLQWLGVKPSYSRPRVSDDNAYAESLFRTAKYRPEFPTAGFASLEVAAKEIGDLATNSVKQADRAGTLLNEMVPAITKTSDLVQEINAASEEQATGMQQINQAVGQLNAVTQQNASASEELAATAEEMNAQAQQLQDNVSQFKLPGETLQSQPVRDRTASPRQPKSSVKAQSPQLMTANAAEFVKF
jgi:transposase InsO family protein